MDRIPSSSSSAGGPGTDAGTPCVFRVLRVSGTMRKAEEEAIRRARREILRTRKIMADRDGGVADALNLGREDPADDCHAAAADFAVEDDDDIMDDAED